jgi:hypothetical protein
LRLRGESAFVLNLDEIHPGVSKVFKMLVYCRLSEIKGGWKVEKKGGRNMGQWPASLCQSENHIALIHA